MPAFGYLANWPKLLDSSGNEMEWSLDPADGQALMNNSTSQLSVKVKASSLGEQIDPMPNVFGAGLGFGLKAGGELKIGEQVHGWAGVGRVAGTWSSGSVRMPSIISHSASCNRAFESTVRRSTTLGWA